MNDALTFSFDTPETTAAFSVDAEKRTIRGLAVPYGATASTRGRTWSFSKGSLTFADVSRVKLLVQHDMSQAVGKAIKLEDTDAGLMATFKVARTPAGDHALVMAEDGVWDGLSVGVGEGGTFEERDGVFHAVSMPLAETSLTPSPAFSGARVMQVTAEKGSSPMGDDDIKPEGTVVTLTRDDIKTIFAEFATEHGLGQREVASPSGGTAQTVEAPLYRFDGRKGQRCFTADIASGAFADAELREKAEAFIGDTMEAVFANITSGNVATLNPTIQRPDLYVPNLYFERPIGQMVTGGVVNEITTQTLPKFSASSGMAAAHTPGSEPSAGAFSTTSQVVTPVGISGRVDINREVVDQGGSPQADQLVWNEMTQAYAQILETRIVDALQALSLSDTPIVGVDEDLQDALLALFAGFQFIKGGDRYRGLAMHQDIYAAVIGAKDGEGRPLFPMGNPVNANGAVTTDLSQVRVGNKIGVPAWALASGNGGPDKSFLFVPSSVYQWFSPPRRIDLAQANVATVSIGMWGYSAEFITRTTDVKQLGYSAT